MRSVQYVRLCTAWVICRAELQIKQWPEVQDTQRELQNNDGELQNSWTMSQRIRRTLTTRGGCTQPATPSSSPSIPAPATPNPRFTHILRTLTENHVSLAPPHPEPCPPHTLAPSAGPFPLAQLLRASPHRNRYRSMPRALRPSLLRHQQQLRASGRFLTSITSWSFGNPHHGHLVTLF